MLRVKLFLTMFVLGAASAGAASFDLIVPSEVLVRTQPGISGVGSPWGWVVATVAPLSLEQLNSQLFTLATDNSEVTVSTTFNPSSSWTPMQPGDIAGLDVPQFTDALRQLQQAREVVNPLSSNFWRWSVDFTPEFVGQVTLHTMLSIDDDTASFDTLLRFNPAFGTDVDPIVTVSAQRVSAVPEPCALKLLAVAAVLYVIAFAGRSQHSGSRIRPTALGNARLRKHGLSQLPVACETHQETTVVTHVFWNSKSAPEKRRRGAFDASPSLVS